MANVRGLRGSRVTNAASPAMLKNGLEPASSCRDTMTDMADGPMFSMVKEPRLSSRRSPIALITACGCTVKMTFGGASTTLTARTFDGGPGFVGSHDGSARTR